MRKPITGLLAVAALAVVGGAGSGATASHGCNGDVTSVPTAAGTFYLDDRSASATAVDSVWIYEEVNDTPGLQSGGPSMFGWFDPCGHALPDALIF